MEEPGHLQTDVMKLSTHNFGSNNSQGYKCMQFLEQSVHQGLSDACVRIMPRYNFFHIVEICCGLGHILMKATISNEFGKVLAF